jgi:peptidoglycan/xylan/chitin deacetylase (PgdA/CDA1 family)
VSQPRTRNSQKRPRRLSWLAAIALAAIACIGAIVFSRMQAPSGTTLQAKTGLADFAATTQQAIQATPIDFEVPKEYQAKTIKDTIVTNGEKLIALTFDDGPWPQTTEQILATLKQENIKATFYVIGQPLISFPEIGKKVLADGHVIANHTLHHWYHKMSPLVAQREIDDTAKIIKQVLGVRTAYFRPPGGVLTNGLVEYSQKLGQSVNMWSVDSGDSRPRRPSPEQLVKTVLSQATPGGIVLMHDGGGNHEGTARALPEMIRQLRAQGYKFVTMPELLQASLTTPAPTTPSIAPTTPAAPKG